MLELNQKTEGWKREVSARMPKYYYQGQILAGIIFAQLNPCPQEIIQQRYQSNGATIQNQIVRVHQQNQRWWDRVQLVAIPMIL